MNKRFANIKGFTLIEILIAITIFAMIVAILYPSYTGTFRNIEAAESQSRIFHMARITLERMTDDLQSAYIIEKTDDEIDEDEFLKSTGFLGEDSSVEGKDADSLRFTSEEHISFNESDRKGRGLISYTVEENDNGLIIHRADSLILENFQEDEQEGYILCENLDSINFTYTDEEGEVHDYWDSSQDEFKNKLPVLVTVKLDFINKPEPESPIEFMTSISLPLAWNRYATNL